MEYINVILDSDSTQLDTFRTSFSKKTKKIHNVLDWLEKRAHSQRELLEFLYKILREYTHRVSAKFLINFFQRVNIFVGLQGS